MELSIELLGRGNRQLDLVSFTGNRITVGRAYDNDIILSDPYVCPHHLVIEINDSGEIQLTDLGSVNGTHDHKHKPIDKSCKVNSGEEFILGKSRIRIYRRDHAVAPTLQLSWVDKLAQLLGNPLFVAGAILTTILLNLLFQFSNTSKAFNFSREIITAIGALLIIAIWPTCWTLYSRMKKHDAHFLAQLSATIIFLIMFSLLDKIENWLAYHFGLQLSISLLITVILAVMTLLLVWLNYYLSTFMDSKKRWIYSIATTCLLGSFAYLVSSYDSDSFKRRPEYAASLYLPSLSFHTTTKVSDYLQDAGFIFSQSAEMAKQE